MILFSMTKRIIVLETHEQIKLHCVSLIGTQVFGNFKLILIRFLSHEKLSYQSEIVKEILLVNIRKTVKLTAFHDCFPK